MQAAEMFKVQDYGVIVTGGASGIGLACAEVLAEHGARVCMLDLNAERLEREGGRLRDAGWDVRGVAVDLTDRAALDRAFDEAAGALGRLDVVFANAGIDPGVGVLGPTGERTVDGAFEAYADARWDWVIDANLNTVFSTIRAAARHMKPQRAGRIIVTTSVASVRATPIAAAYSAAKAGAAHLMRNAALELARYDIRVNAIAPGPFVTNIGGGHVHDPAVQALMARRIPLGRVGDTEEMKGLALFLASPASSFMTGAEIFNDGGMSIGPPID